MNRGDGPGRDAFSRAEQNRAGVRPAGLASSPPAATILIGVLGLVGLFLLQATFVRHHVEDELTGRTTLALNAIDLPQARVDLSGRDVTLRGLDPQQGERARAAVLTVRGVRAVDVVAAPPGPVPVPVPAPEPSLSLEPVPSSVPSSSLVPVTPAPEPAPADQPKSQLPFSLTFAGGGVRLTGWVGSEEQRQAVLAAVGAGGRPVDDQLMVDPTLAGASRPRVAALAAVVRAVPTPGGGLIVRYVDGKAQVRGAVGSAATETAVLRAVSRTTPPGPTEDHVKVP